MSGPAGLSSNSGNTIRSCLTRQARADLCVDGPGRGPADDSTSFRDISEEQPMKDEMASGRGSIYSVEKRTSVTAREPAPATGARRAGAWFVHELHEILPPLTFFFVGFNLIVQTTNLIVANYSVAVGNFMLATTGALIVGKAVPVANAMPFIRRYDRAPLIQ